MYKEKRGAVEENEKGRCEDLKKYSMKCCILTAWDKTEEIKNKKEEERRKSNKKKDLSIKCSYKVNVIIMQLWSECVHHASLLTISVSENIEANAAAASWSWPKCTYAREKVCE